MIVDTHTHLGRYEIGEATPEMLLAAMDKAGVDYALAFAHEHRLPNRGISTEEIIQVSRKYSRIIGIGTANPTQRGGDPFWRRTVFLGRALKDRLIHGIKFYLGYEHFYPTDERLDELYDILQNESLPAIFHTGFFYDPEREGLIKYAQPLPVDELALRFPKLKIVIAHMGNPRIAECGEVMLHNMNVFADVSGYFNSFVTPFSVEERQQFIDDLEMLRVRFALNCDRLLFATDWPINDMGEYVKLCKSITATNADSFFAENAIRLFQIQI